MPVAAVLMVYGGGTALAAGAAGWAAFAAGAMVVGGAASLIGTATGDEKLEKDGMIIGGIGSLGYGALSAGGYSGTAANVQAAQGGGAGAAPEQFTEFDPANPTPSGAWAPNAAAPGTVATPSPSIMTEIEASNLKFTEAMSRMQTQNLIAQTAGGIGQAYSGHQQAKTEEGIINRKLDEEKAIRDRDYANANNLTGLTIPTPQLPDFGSQYAQQGPIQGPPIVRPPRPLLQPR